MKDERERERERDSGFSCNGALTQGEKIKGERGARNCRLLMLGAGVQDWESW